MSVKIALAGNPNCGKTTLFNAQCTGSNQFVGNWPGVTVEKKGRKVERAERCHHHGPARYLLPVTVHSGGGCSKNLPDQ